MRGRKRTPNDISIQGETAFMVLTNRAGFPIAVTLVDPGDVALIRSWGLRWSASWHNDNYRVSTRERVGGRMRTVYLHRKLLGTAPGMDTDHINHNTLDNRRGNLRELTRQENAVNYRIGAYHVLREDRPSLAVSRAWYVEAHRGVWRLRMKVGRRRTDCGMFLTREEAEQARDRAATEYRTAAA